MNASANCTCCLTQRPAGPVAPQCPAPTPTVLPNCQCDNALANSTVQSCNCSRVQNGVESYFNKVNTSTCSCVVTQVNGRNINQCQCCASQAQLTLASPTCAAKDQSLEQCSCTADLKCDCAYKNMTTLRGLQQSATTCACPSNNATSKACQCCVSAQSYRDANTPSCAPQDVLGTCACSSVTATVGKSKIVSQLCNCTGDLKSERSTSIANTNINLTSSRCGQY